jgi:hypothetical protein
MRSTQGKKQRDPIPEHFDSIEEAADFWDRHSPVDYPEFFRPVQAEVNSGSITYELTFDAEFDKQLPACARKRGVNVPELIKLWLEEKVAEERPRQRREKAAANG